MSLFSNHNIWGLGFTHSQVSNGAPSAIRLPCSQGAEGRELAFEKLHEKGETVEILLEAAAVIGE